MAEQFQNFFVTKLREACDATATTIYVDTVPAITEGTLVLEYANSTKHEIIHFTGVSGYGLTGCTRGLEGTTAQSHSAGTDVRQNLTAGIIDKIINGVITTENIANSAVTTAKINNGAVTADKIDFTTLSTQEQVVGKWVDGKTIYRKNFSGTFTTSADGSRTMIQLLTGVDDVIDIKGYFSPNSNGNENYPVPVLVGSAGIEASLSARVTAATDTLQLLFQSPNYLSKTARYNIFVYYTKTS